MKTLAIISHKGGAGKTSSSVMVAEDLARRGLRVVLVDADRQRGAGLLLGIEPQPGVVQQTRNPRLRYFCSSGLPLRELPGKAAELKGLFEMAVVDTPSLDDPLARAWLQHAGAVLMVLPVEPISLRTLDGADAALAQVRRLNPGIQPMGLLPTMFDESDPNQRALMVELVSRCPEGLLSPAIPADPGLAHRAEQKEERRSEAAEATRAAYQAVGDRVLRFLADDEAPAGTSSAGLPAGAWRPAGGAGAARSEPASRPPATVGVARGAEGPGPRPRRVRPLLIAVVVALLVLLVLGAGLLLRPRSMGAATGIGTFVQAQRQGETPGEHA